MHETKTRIHLELVRGTSSPQICGTCRFVQADATGVRCRLFGGTLFYATGPSVPTGGFLRCEGCMEAERRPVAIDKLLKEANEVIARSRVLLSEGWRDVEAMHAALNERRKRLGTENKGLNETDSSLRLCFR